MTPARRAGDTEVVAFEALWPLRLALVAAIVLYVTLPDRVIPGPRFVIPALEAMLLLALTALAPRRHHGVLPHVRAISLALVGLISAANIASLGLLVHELLQNGNPNGRTLIVASIQIWLTNVIAFGFWYWELDGGGPARRARGTAGTADFLFPQMTKPDVAPPNWRPTFVDYLFTSFTNATAFSPTDTMPLSPGAKLLFMLQSAASLITVALVAARAVNILGG